MISSQLLLQSISVFRIDRYSLHRIWRKGEEQTSKRAEMSNIKEVEKKSKFNKLPCNLLRQTGLRKLWDR